MEHDDCHTTPEHHVTPVAAEAWALAPPRSARLTPAPALLDPTPGDQLAVELAEAENLLAAKRYREAAVAFEELSPALHANAGLAFQALLGESWARMYLGELQSAIVLLERGRMLAENPDFTDVHRADVLYRLGCCRFKLSAIANAVSLFTLALELCERAAGPDRLRANILEWRSRCYRHQRDWEAARADVERALELAQSIGDSQSVAHVYFQASLIAERGGQFLIARMYAEEAKHLYETLDDRSNVGRLLNNLGGLAFLLQKPEEACGYLSEAFHIALEVGSDADAAQAMSSLAQVNLRTGDAELAEGQARQALELLAGRIDFLDEIGNAQLVLGGALAAQERYDEADTWLRAAEASFEQFDSSSHRAAASVARGDLARSRGDETGAADLYRRAAEQLQDFHF
jgi:tetratricopeptide (TPR) repeat protein